MQASNLLPDINATGQQVDKCRHRCSRRCAFEDARVALKTAASSTIACVMFRMLYHIGLHSLSDPHASLHFIAMRSLMWQSSSMAVEHHA